MHGPIHNPQLRETMKAEGLACISFLPPAPTANYFKTAVTYAAGANKTVTTTSFTKASCLGWPVVPVILVGEDSGDTFSAVSSIVMGYDQFGDFQTETVAHTNSSGDWTGTCSHAYQTLTSVATTVTGTTDTSDDVVIGFAKTYGVGRKIGASGDVIASTFNGAADAGSLDTTYSTYTMAGTPDKAKWLTLCVRPSHYLG